MRRVLLAFDSVAHAVAYEYTIRRLCRTDLVFVATPESATIPEFFARPERYRRLGWRRLPSPSDRSGVLGTLVRGVLDAAVAREHRSAQDVLAQLPWDASALARRVAQEGLPRSSRRWTWLERVERAQAHDAAFLELLGDVQPQVVAFSPVVRAGSRQQLLVRTARSLGIPTLGLTASGDEFAPGGRLVDPPDVIATWNAAQRRELVERFGYPGQRVAVVGAPCVELCGREEASRDDFCARRGIDRAQVLLAYVAGGELTPAAERDRAARWLAALRMHADPQLRHAQILLCPQEVQGSVWSDEPLADAGVHLMGTGAHPCALAVRYADVVVAPSMAGVLEAAALGKAVAIPHEADGGDLLRYRTFAAGARDRILVAATAVEHTEHLLEAVRHPLTESVKASARLSVAPHGLAIWPSDIFGRRVFQEVVGKPMYAVPAAGDSADRREMRTAETWAETQMLSPVSTSGPQVSVLLVAASSLAVLGLHRALLDELLVEGHQLHLAWTGPALQEDVRAIAVEEFGFESVHHVPVREGKEAEILGFTLAHATSEFLAEHAGGDRAQWRARLKDARWPAGFQTTVRVVTRLLGAERVDRLLETASRELPPIASLSQFLSERHPSALVILAAADVQTSLASVPRQHELVRAVRAAGLPVVGVTTPGDMPVDVATWCAAPDSAFVADDVARAQLSRHASVRQTFLLGSACADEWLAPATADEDVASLIGVPKGQPFLLFAGSAGVLTSASADVRWLGELVDALRGSRDAAARDVPVVVRPAPAATREWRRAKLARAAHVFLFPRDYDPSGETDLTLLVETVRRASVVVSSEPLPLIVAAAVGTPTIGVGPVRADLVQHGIRDWVDRADAALPLVVAAMARPSSDRDAKPFVRRALRPLDPDVPVAPRIAAEIGRCAAGDVRWLEARWPDEGWSARLHLAAARTLLGVSRVVDERRLGRSPKRSAG